MYAFVVAYQGLLLNILFVTGAVCFLLGEGFFGRLAGLNPALARKDTIPAGVLTGITSALFLGGSFYLLDRFSGDAYTTSVRAALQWSDLSPIALVVGYGALSGFLPMFVRGFVRVTVGERLDAIAAARGEELRELGEASSGLGYALLVLIPLLWLPSTFVMFALADHVRVLLGWLGGHEAPIWLLILLAILMGVFRVIFQGCSRALNGGYPTKEERQAYMGQLYVEDHFLFVLWYTMLLATYIPWLIGWLITVATLGYLIWLSGIILLAISVGSYLLGLLHIRLVRLIANAPAHTLFVVFSIGSGLTVFLGRYVLDPGLLPTFLR